MMQSLTMRSLKKHYSLAPLLVSIGAGCVLATVYTIRLAVQCPDVSWNKKTNPEPWQKLGLTGQYKLYSTFDYKQLEKPEGKPDLD